MKMNPVVHFEMPAEDNARLIKFYSTVFGWQMKEWGAEMGNYVVATTTPTDPKTSRPTTPGAINGGFFKKSDDNKIPSVVIAVDDIAEAMKKVTEAGGKVLGEPMDIPGVGKYVSFEDSEKNKVSILQPSGM